MVSEYDDEDGDLNLNYESFLDFEELAVSFDYNLDSSNSDALTTAYPNFSSIVEEGLQELIPNVDKNTPANSAMTQLLSSEGFNGDNLNVDYNDVPSTLIANNEETSTTEATDANVVTTLDSNYFELEITGTHENDLLDNAIDVTTENNELPNENELQTALDTSGFESTNIDAEPFPTDSSVTSSSASSTTSRSLSISTMGSIPSETMAINESGFSATVTLIEKITTLSKGTDTYTISTDISTVPTLQLFETTTKNHLIESKVTTDANVASSDTTQYPNVEPSDTTKHPTVDPETTSDDTFTAVGITKNQVVEDATTEAAENSENIMDKEGTTDIEESFMPQIENHVGTNHFWQLEQTSVQAQKATLDR